MGFGSLLNNCYPNRDCIPSSLLYPDAVVVETNSTTGPRHIKKYSASLVSKPDATCHDECPPRDQAAIAEDLREIEDEAGEQGTESRSERDQN